MSKSPYHEAGNLLDQVLTHGKSLRSVFYTQPSSSGGGGSKLRCTKATYASVCNTLKHRSRIDAVLNHDGGALKRSIKFDETRSKGLLYVLLYEMLYGKYGSIRGGGRVKRNVCKFEKELRSVKEELEAFLGGADGGGGGGSSSSSGAPAFPRYVRVNTLKICTREAADVLRRDVLGGESGDAGGEIYADRHVPDLLVLPPSSGSKLHSHELVSSGKVVLQDKSSCFSALALARGCLAASDDDERFDCIDACAAPGNKTTHLAALLAQQTEQRTERAGEAPNAKSDKKKGGGGSSKRTAGGRKCRVFAFDRASRRVKILQDRVSNLVPDGKTQHVQVKPMHRDFLQVDPSERAFANVRAILLDPSCSGSGIVNAPDRLAEAAGASGSRGDKEEKRRVETLSNFQLVALKHAMSFPKVDRIVYSTCSVHDRENEDVVAAALREYNEGLVGGEDDLALRWEAVPPDCLRHWERRGRSRSSTAAEGEAGALTESESESLIRCDGLDGDETNGFFVAYLERRRFSAERRRGVRKLRDGREEQLEPAAETEALPTYNGEFKAACLVGEHSPQRCDSTETPARKATASKSPKNGQKNGKTNEGKGSSSSSVAESCEGKKKSAVSRKKAKKLAWKRKQMALKMKRLQAKKANK